MPLAHAAQRRWRELRSRVTRDEGMPRVPRQRRAIADGGSAPGSRRVPHGFFDDYPGFYETSETFAHPSRLNLRHEAIFGENRDLFPGRRVLDIASHDGRWSFAALQAGADHVVGVEGRPELVAAAHDSFAHYGIEPDRYRFVAGDVFSALRQGVGEFDVVLCLGFLYHTLRYNELLSRIRQTGATYLVVDTEVATGGRPLVQLRTEHVAPQRNAVADEFSHADTVLSGRPTLKGLEVILGAYDFRVERFSDWAGLLRDDNPEHADELEHYRDGTRVTARCRAVDR